MNIEDELDKFLSAFKLLHPCIEHGGPVASYCLMVGCVAGYMRAIGASDGQLLEASRLIAQNVLDEYNATLN